MPNINKQPPYLSVVVAGRNDNYGGDFLRRLQHFVDRLSYLVEKYQLSSELLLVNYNPIPDKAGLETLIQWPKQPSWLRIRMLTVPPEVHEAYVDPNTRKTVPLFEFIAKNIGIRRAKGTFILATNADILFSEELFGFIAQRTLQKKCLYRVNRIDFKPPRGASLAPHTAGFEERVETHAYRFFLRGGTFDLRRPRSLQTRLYMLNAYNKLRYTFYTLFNHFWLTRLVNRLLYIYTDSIFLLRYHCNASGDFALLDRESWLMMGGYREDTWISTHTDSIHVMEAVTLGCHTRVLPYPIFHQAHERRYDFSEANPDMELMYQRLLSQAKQMQKSGNIAQKKPDWGLKSNILKEVCPK